MPKKLKILTTENKKEKEILRQKSKKVMKEEIGGEEFKNFVEDLIFTAKNHKLDKGWITAGLAAIQVGKPIQVFTILNSETQKYEIYINPEIKEVGTKKEKSIEGCLSLPKKEKEIMRYKKIKVKYIDIEGKKRKEIHKDSTARVIQHEYDHLQGILFTDKE